MQRSLITRWLFNSFWLSLLLHLLLLLLFSMVMIIKSPEKQKPPHDYVPTYTVPSYAYSSPSQPMMQPRHSEENKPVISHKIRMSQQKIFHTKKIPLEKPQEQKESVLASSLRILQENQFKNLHPIKNEDPIYLIGDMSKWLIHSLNY
ncbi:MAG: hypothetical protein JO149_02035 [Gammaproteobacteria bacterium]|nr:hypothetical protein [Gammaproteobacteria bacterium]